MFKKLIKLLLTLFLARVNPTFAPREPVTEKFNVVTLGSSNGTGYGLHGFIPEELYNDPMKIYSASGNLRDGYYSSGYLYEGNGNYSELLGDLLQDEFGDSVTVKVDNLSINSLRAYDVDYILNENKPADKYITWRLGDGSKDSGWMYDINRAREDKIDVKGVDGKVTYKKDATDLRTEYRNAIKDADLITYDLGVNDFGVYLSNQITSDYYDADMSKLIPDHIDMYNSVVAMLNAKILEYFENEITVDDLMFYNKIFNDLAYAFVGFATSFDDTMKIIYELNPDVEVVVLSIPNMLKGWKGDFGSGEVDIGGLYGALIELANYYTSFLSPYAGRHYYANTQAAKTFRDEILDWDGNIAHLDSNIIETFDCLQEGMVLPAIVDGLVAAESLTGTAATAAKTAALNVAHYGLAKACQIAFKDSQLIYSAISDVGSTMNSFSDILTNVIDVAIKSPAMASILCGAVEGTLNKTFADEEARSALAVAMLTRYANSFFSHISSTGHIQTSQEIFAAYKYRLAPINSLTFDPIVLDIYAQIVNLESTYDSFEKDVKGFAEDVYDIATKVYGEVKDVVEKVEEVVTKVEDEIEKANKKVELLKSKISLQINRLYSKVLDVQQLVHDYFDFLNADTLEKYSTIMKLVKDVDVQLREYGVQVTNKALLSLQKLADTVEDFGHKYVDPIAEKVIGAGAIVYGYSQTEQGKLIINDVENLFFLLGGQYLIDYVTENNEVLIYVTVKTTEAVVDVVDNTVVEGFRIEIVDDPVISDNINRIEDRVSEFVDNVSGNLGLLDSDIEVVKDDYEFFKNTFDISKDDVEDFWNQFLEDIFC